MNVRLSSISSLRLRSAGVAACLAVLSACSSLPRQNTALEHARARLHAAQVQPNTVTLAVDELARARESLRRADAALVNGETAGEVNHLSYMTLQEVVIAEEAAASRNAQAVIAGAKAERDRMRLELRNDEADAAQAQKLRAGQAAAVKSAQPTRH